MISACKSVQNKVYDYIYVQSALPKILVDNKLNAAKFQKNLEAFNASGKKGFVNFERACPPEVAVNFGVERKQKNFFFLSSSLILVMFRW